MEKSESITKLSAALVKFGAMMTAVKKDSINPHFRNKYASLSAIIEGTQGSLAECGLAVVQLPAGDNQLTTMIIHESGEYISETYTMRPARNDPQGLGSAITYQRRYALGAILNLNIDEDDDGNQASAPEKPEGKVPKRRKLVEGTEEFRTVLDALVNGYNDKPVTMEQVERKYIVDDEVKKSLTAAVDAAKTKTK